MGDVADPLLLPCPSPGAAQRGHAAPWTPLSKDNLKYRHDGYYSQEEPLNYCKSSASAHKGVSPGLGGAGGVGAGGWPLRPNSGPLRTGQGVGYLASNRLNKAGHYGRPYRLSPGCPAGRAVPGEVFVSKLYGNVQLPSDPDVYCVDLVKNENGYGECYDGHPVPEVPPIKVEHDSDSENGCEAYGQPWACRDPEAVDRRYGNGAYAAQGSGLHLKAEADYYDPQYSPCQRGKAGISPPYHAGPHPGYPSYALSNGGGGGGRLLKCDKDLGAEHFSPQRLSHSDSLCSNQSINLVDGHVYPQDGHKAYVHPDYGHKHAAYELKGHGLIHAIKREPVDSPPWAEGAHELGQPMMLGPRNVMPCVMSAGPHKASPYIYLP